MKIFHNTQNASNLRGFTLIELLVVVSIIVVLAGLTVGVAGFVQRKTSASKANTQLQQFMAKMEEYKQDAGSFPVKRDNNGLIVYTMLYGDGLGPDLVAGTPDDTRPDGEPDEGATVYLADLNPATNPAKMLEVRSGSTVPTKLVDPWGGSWRYRSGDQYKPMNPDFDLWSLGPDGKDNTGDEVKNW